MSKLSFKLLALVLAVIGVGVLAVNLVSAHPSLANFGNDSAPQPGTLLEVSPEEVRVVFNQESVHGGMDAENSLFYLIRQEGRAVVTVGKVDLDDPTRSVMVAELNQPLEPGLYTVKWIGISTPDGGFSEGAYDFAVQGGGE